MIFRQLSPRLELQIIGSSSLFVSIARNPNRDLRRFFREIEEKEASGYNLRAIAHNFVLYANDNRNCVSLTLYAELNT